MHATCRFPPRSSPRVSAWCSPGGAGAARLGGVQIYVDADGCPVREEVFRVAKRYALAVHVVANGWMATPDAPRVAMVVVGQGLDAADDWIVAHAGASDVVVTADIPLAARCVAKNASVLHPTGKRFTPNDVGGALA